MRNDRLNVIRKIKLDLSNAKFSSQENMADYPWDKCIADQIERYGDEETAKKVCGAIKAGMKSSFQEGDSLESACWPGYTAVGLKPSSDGSRLVPNCVPLNEENAKVVKEGFPIPSPEGGEDEQTYISRCMKQLVDEFPDQSQRAAVCYDKWKEVS